MLPWELASAPKAAHQSQPSLPTSLTVGFVRFYEQERRTSWLFSSEHKRPQHSTGSKGAQPDTRPGLRASRALPAADLPQRGVAAPHPTARSRSAGPAAASPLRLPQRRRGERERPPPRGGALPGEEPAGSRRARSPSSAGSSQTQPPGAGWAGRPAGRAPLPHGAGGRAKLCSPPAERRQEKRGGMGPEALPLGPYGGAAAAALLLWVVCVLCRRKRYRSGGSGAGAPRGAGLRGGRRGWAARRALGRAPSARPSAARSPISARRGPGATGGGGAAGPGGRAWCAAGPSSRGGLRLGVAGMRGRPRAHTHGAHRMALGLACECAWFGEKLFAV